MTDTHKDMNDLFATPAYKLVRRDDPSTSHDAAEQLDVNRMEKIVYDTIDALALTDASQKMCLVCFMSMATAQLLLDTNNSKKKDW